MRQQRGRGVQESVASAPLQQMHGREGQDEGRSLHGRPEPEAPPQRFDGVGQPADGGQRHPGGRQQQQRLIPQRSPEPELRSS